MKVIAGEMRGRGIQFEDEEPARGRSSCHSKYLNTNRIRCFSNDKQNIKTS